MPEPSQRLPRYIGRRKRRLLIRFRLFIRDQWDIANVEMHAALSSLRNQVSSLRALAENFRSGWIF
jgi:predicted KAP-like P-loop ATPase